MRNEKLIIGVVGPTRRIDKINPTGTITKLAQAVGQEITKAGQVLLTGGEPVSDIPSPIKSAAMEGAKTAGTQNSPARLISVLPRAAKFDVVYKNSDPACRHLIINTKLNDERNFINGCVPDAVVAIHGGAGTLSEIAFANAIGTPIVFLQTDGVDTLAALRGVPEDGLNEILQSTNKAFPFFNIVSLLHETRCFINGKPPNISNSPLSAVKMAISVACQRIMSSFNSLPYHHGFIGAFDLYETHLNTLVK